eukprot:204403-Pyramimonas_sp.AAC.1
MDDVSLQRQGPDSRDAAQVFAATAELRRLVKPVGLLLQPNKPGPVALSAAAEKKAAFSARMLGFA